MLATVKSGNEGRGSTPEHMNDIVIVSVIVALYALTHWLIAVIARLGGGE